MNVNGYDRQKLQSFNTGMNLSTTAIKIIIIIVHGTLRQFITTDRLR